MKRILPFVFGVIVLASGQAAVAQMLDDLFDEEDFQSSEIEKMQQETAIKNQAAQKAASAAPPQPKAAAAPASAAPTAAPSTPAVPPAVGPASSPAGVPPQMPVGTVAPKTLSLSAGPRAITMPQIGAGKEESMPYLGANAKKRNDENLSLFEMRAKKTGFSNTNVSSFDIAGIRLQMTPDEVIEKASEAGFSLKFKDWKIPQLNEWKYHRQCLDKMSFAHGTKKNCIHETAQEENSEYINRLVFENRPRRETLSVEFTSMYMQNQSYRIRYINKGDHSLGATEEGRYLKTKRRQEFLETLIKKYGLPDDESAMLWGVEGRGATLHAEISNTFLDASLVMENLSMEEKDFDAVANEELKTDPFNNFSF